MDFSVVIPAYNEEESIAGLLEKLTREARVSPRKIIVVDDGSTDSTSLVASRLGVVLRRHARNEGKGAAIATGVRASQTGNIVLMDGDGQHNPSDIAAMLEALKKSELVIGSRFLGKKNEMPLHREVANRLVSFIVSRRRKVSDPLSGFRAFRKSRVRISESGFNADLEMVFNALDGKAKVNEVAIHALYAEKKSSKFSRLLPALSAYLSLLLYAARRTFIYSKTD